ncbi:MAG: UPF0280 family protein [Spirochaetia bacterium]|nr:UPF0280 family protein [Spirochaetia bacterium]
MFQNRTYRYSMGSCRFSSFSLAIAESDVWIGFQGDAECDAIRKETASFIRRLRSQILAYEDKAFLSSLVPLSPKKDVSEFLRGMFDAGKKAQVGPMASVAGSVAQEVGRHLKQVFSLSEIVVENGGDLYIDVLKPLSVKLFAPTSRFSGNISLIVDPQFCPLGLCTSSATFGHSMSFGKADAVMVACSDAALSDAYATAFCNKVQKKEDVQRVCEELVSKSEVLSSIIVLDDTLAVGGRLEVSTCNE